MLLVRVGSDVSGVMHSWFSEALAIVSVLVVAILFKFFFGSSSFFVALVFVWSLFCWKFCVSLSLARFVDMSVVGVDLFFCDGANGVACICFHMWFASYLSGNSGHVQGGHVKLRYRSPMCCKSRIPLDHFLLQ